MNIKAQLDRHIILVLMFVVIFSVVIFLIWGGAILFPMLVDSGQEISSSINGVIQEQDSGTAMGNASQQATVLATGILGSIEIMVYATMIGLLLGYIAICYYVRTMKVLAAIWFIVIICMVVVSMILSNAYIQAAETPDFNFYETWGSNDFLMRHLPMIVGTVSVFSGILLFVIMQREPEEEEGVL